MPALVDPALTLDRWRGDGQPTITGTGVALRPWAPTDVDVLVRAYADPDVQRWHVQSKTSAEAARWIDRWPARWQAGTGVDWAVASTDDGVVLGRIGFRAVDLFEGEAEVAYWTLPEARGRGVASAAVDALTTWAFDLGLLRIALRHSVHNTASCHVAERSGYAAEGTMRRAGRHADGPHDMHLHARLA